MKTETNSKKLRSVYLLPGISIEKNESAVKWQRDFAVNFFFLRWYWGIRFNMARPLVFLPTGLTCRIGGKTVIPKSANGAGCEGCAFSHEDKPSVCELLGYFVEMPCRSVNRQDNIEVIFKPVKS